MWLSSCWDSISGQISFSNISASTVWFPSTLDFLHDSNARKMNTSMTTNAKTQTGTSAMMAVSILGRNWDKIALVTCAYFLALVRKFTKISTSLLSVPKKTFGRSLYVKEGTAKLFLSYSILCMHGILVILFRHTSKKISALFRTFAMPNICVRFWSILNGFVMKHHALSFLIFLGS